MTPFASHLYFEAVPVFPDLSRLLSVVGNAGFFLTCWLRGRSRKCLSSGFGICAVGRTPHWPRRPTGCAVPVHFRQWDTRLLHRIALRQATRVLQSWDSLRTSSSKNHAGVLDVQKVQASPY
ncbi:hypothetical protein CSUI_000396 [Cystoisospora suis]|uniref:Uncharacterized protein n=1 Tax=Cystoisospora suis TaxID=483139 RepID=A0A2C6LH22_9APIC|nr:hypothetical protein CSUI_000396 [Cystoisospora suis]